METATKRIPLSPKTWEQLRDFKNGLHCDYDTAIQKLFELGLKDHPQDKYQAGKSIRPTGDK